MKPTLHQIAKDNLYSFIPLFFAFFQPLVICGSLYISNGVVMLLLSLINLSIMLFMYRKLVSSERNQMKKRGGMSTFEKNQMYSHLITWWLAMLFSFVSSCMAIGLLLGY